MHSSGEDLKRFESLTYDDFRRMAEDDSLSRHEKIGFPDSYREGREAAIFEDIVEKLPALQAPDRLVLDIGPGCGGLPRMLIDLCRRVQNRLVLVDSPEMLAQLADEPFIHKVPGRFPGEASLDEYVDELDVILVYSVLHYVFAEGALWTFLRRSLKLLASGGSMLLGDIPNESKRTRFFTSDAGLAFHRDFMGDDSLPDVAREGDVSRIDDSVVLDVLRRARESGFDAYVVAQRDDLPMANRREDILIVRP
jgi:SAM-dependent methyltransferase